MGLDVEVVLYTLGIYTAIVVSPGPNFALISRMALQGRNHTARGAIVGLAAAATFYALLAMIGLAAVLNEIGWLVRVVQVLGGLYLVYLGLLSWRSPGAIPGQPQQNRFIHSGSLLTETVAGFKMGAAVNLSNPKGIAFFVGLYAVAVPADASVSTRMAILLGGALLELGWYSIVAGLLSRSRFRKIYSRFSIWIERSIGSVLIIFGGKMVLNK